MPRIARKYIQTNFIHIVTQGLKKEYIFYKEEYKNEYIKLLKKNVKILKNIKLISYCVMSNHAHILIHTKNIDEVSILMRKLNTSYAIYYNYMEDRTGYVFANRYYAQPVRTKRHLLVCIEYIHKNPVKAGIVKSENIYKYSTFNIFNQNKLNKEVAKLVFDTENYLMQFHNIDKKVDNFEVIDIYEEKIGFKKVEIEDMIEEFCKTNQVSLKEVRKSNYLIMKLKNYLSINLKVTNKIICETLKIGKNRINAIEKRKY